MGGCKFSKLTIPDGDLARCSTRSREGNPRLFNVINGHEGAGCWWCGGTYERRDFFPDEVLRSACRKRPSTLTFVPPACGYRLPPIAHWKPPTCLPAWLRKCCSASAGDVLVCARRKMIFHGT
jgi:hypothetical protein